MIHKQINLLVRLLISRFIIRNFGEFFLFRNIYFKKMDFKIKISSLNKIEKKKEY